MRQDIDATDRLAIQPGQIWLIEQYPGADLSLAEREALAAANVVLYERPLAPFVAGVLTLGTYAEPLPASWQLAGPAIAERAVRFANEGWSVVQLTVLRTRPHERLARVGTGTGWGLAGNTPIMAMVKQAGTPAEARSAFLRELPEMLNGSTDHPLTLVIGPVVFRYRPQSHVFTAQGLAG